MKKLIFLLSLTVALTANLFSQKKGYDLQITINNYPDSVTYLVHYYGNTNMIKDTAYIKNGSFRFQGNETLPGGIYLIVTTAKTYFELIIDKEQHFSITTSNDDFVKNAKIKGSNDNQLFFDYLKFLGQKEEEKKTIDNQYSDKEDAEQKKAHKEKLKTLNEEVISYKEKLMTGNPESFVTTILKASKEPETPTELPKKEDGSPDSTYIYKYYKAHYWDNFDLSDERLLRTPLYANRLKRYFTQVLLQHPDTLIKESDMLIAKAKPNRETYKYNIWYLTYETETSKIMGMDAVFVHLVKKYYETGEAYWVNESVMKNIVSRANTLDKLLIGRPGPNMIMIDTANNLKSMYALKGDYTIVLFYDPDCGHCRSEVKEIRNWFKAYEKEYNMKIFAVCSDTSLVKWKKFIKENDIANWDNVNGTRSATENYHDLYDIISTPTIYLLDKNKNILAKRLAHHQLIEFIERDVNKKKKTQD